MPVTPSVLEFKGTGNAELILSRKIANKRVFPAVDVIQSSTRKEEILLAPEELVIVHKLRRVLNALDPEQAIDLLLGPAQAEPDEHRVPHADRQVDARRRTSTAGPGRENPQAGTAVE